MEAWLSYQRDTSMHSSKKKTMRPAYGNLQKKLQRSYFATGLADFFKVHNAKWLRISFEINSI